jgi:hypothetical protein
VILYIDVPGIGGKRMSLSQVGGEVRHPAVGVVGTVIRTEFVQTVQWGEGWNAGDEIVRVTVEIDEEKLPRG